MGNPIAFQPLVDVRPEGVEPLFRPDQFDDEENIDIRMLVDLFESHRRRVLPCRESAQWLENFLTRWVLGASLEAASGLNRNLAKETRNKLQTIHLREAERYVDAGVVGPKARASILADEIKRFEKTIEGELPTMAASNWSHLRCCIWRARRFGKLPMTWERIAKRLQ